MPASATTKEKISRPPSSPAQWKVSSLALKKTGSRNLWIQPPSTGQPATRPASAAGMANSTSGTVITFGDSCT
jgi:hypothetical protein